MDKKEEEDKYLALLENIDPSTAKMIREKREYFKAKYEQARKEAEIEHERYLREHEEYLKKKAEIEEELTWWDSVKPLPREERVRAICEHIDKKHKGDKAYQERLGAEESGRRKAEDFLDSPQDNYQDIPLFLFPMGEA